MLPLLNTMEAPPPPCHSSKQQQVLRTVSISVLVMSLPVLYVSFLHVPPAALVRDTTFWFLFSNSIIIGIAADSGMLFFRSSSPSDDDLSFAGAVKDDGLRHAEADLQQALVVRDHGDHLPPAVAEADDGDGRAYALVELVPPPANTPETTTSSRDIVAVTPSSANVVAATTRRLTASRSLAERQEERRATTRRRHRPSHSQSQALVPVQDKSVVVVSDEKETRRRHLRRAATADRRPPLPPPEKEEKESEYARLSDEELNRRVEEFIARFNREMRLQLQKEEEQEQAAAA